MSSSQVRGASRDQGGLEAASIPYLTPRISLAASQSTGTAADHIPQAKKAEGGHKSGSQQAEQLVGGGHELALHAKHTGSD